MLTRYLMRILFALWYYIPLLICKTLNVRGKDFEETACLSKRMVLQYFTFHNYKLWMVYVFLICDFTEYFLLS